MPRTKKLWTHVRPKTLEECDANPIIPSWDSVRSSRSPRESVYVCADCGARVRPMKDNEGPESLRALFRF